MMPFSAQDMGFFDTIGRGWKMSKLSMAVVKKDPELMVYVFLSGVMALAAIVAMGLPEFLNMGWTSTEDGKMTPAYMGFLFGGYMGISIIVTFWNSAIVANAYIRLNGGDPKFIDGFSAAFKRIHLIIMWGIIAGTVGLLLKMLKQAAREQKGGGAVLVMILQIIGATIWWIMSFFVIPLMVIEGIGVGESMKKSKQMFMKTWGENVTSGMGIGIITAFFGIINWRHCHSNSNHVVECCRASCCCGTVYLLHYWKDARVVSGNGYERFQNANRTGISATVIYTNSRNSTHLS
jgi:hypothetical protein